jgi:outer membrane protein assembly factor BamE (lipoprotein component of BamABCDE complex)
VTGADGVTVTLSGDASDTKTVSSGGSYSFTVGEGGSYTVTPSKAGYVFTPASRTFTNVTADQALNFTAQVQAITNFTIGSTMDEVRAVQGTPSSVYGYTSFIIWNYGLSSVQFSSGKIVQGYDNYDHNLNVFMGSQEAGKTFTIGSNQAEVLAAQGTPSCVDYYSSFIIWHYGLSSVKFSSDTKIVQSYDNYDKNLNLR